jgi:hypothetical protein
LGLATENMRAAEKQRALLAQAEADAAEVEDPKDRGKLRAELAALYGKIAASEPKTFDVPADVQGEAPAEPAKDEGEDPW